MAESQREHKDQSAFLVGGARLGWLHVTAPFGLLLANQQFVEVIAFPLGRKRFAPEDVLAIEPLTRVPLLAWGVSIVHRRADAPERIIFWSLRPPAAVLRAIERAGFVATGSTAPTVADPAASPDEQPQVGQQFLGAAVLVVALILIVDVLLARAMPGQPRYASIAIPALVFLASLLVRRSGRFRRFAMTRPDAPPQRREVLNFVTLLSGLGLCIAVDELLAHLNIHWR